MFGNAPSGWCVCGGMIIDKNMENYKQRYKEALERASKLRVQNPFDTVGQMVEHIFPELKESDDERMLREIKRYIQEQGDKPTGLPNGTVPVSDMITWLEKQGENKPTDKVEPKFKVGDWIIFNGLVLHIDEVVNGYYRTTSIGDGIHNSYDWDIDNAARLWTIQDAKDGDVLASEDKDKIFLYNGKLDLRGRACAYCGIYKTYDGLRFAKCTVGNYFTYKKPCPTTKEQRDTLFAKMADAGYEWDSEKKELKKIEPKTIDADKVIAWLKNTIYERVENYGVYNETRLILPYNSIEDLINDFKEDFRL